MNITGDGLMRFRSCAVIGALLLLLLLVVGLLCGAEELGATCAECTEGGNVWVVGPLCEETCVAPPSGTRRNVSVWRSSARTSEDCLTPRRCKHTQTHT